MAELLLFAWNHANSPGSPTAEQLAALPNVMDLVTWQDDGWTWGDQELSNPWFRILQLTAIEKISSDVTILNQLLQPVAAAAGISYFQYRGYYLNVSASGWASAVATWWADNTRATPILAAVAPSAISSLIVQRPAVSATAVP